MPRMFDILKRAASKNNIPGVAFPKQIKDNFSSNKNTEKIPVLDSRGFIDAIKKKDFDSIDIANEKYGQACKTVEMLLNKINNKESPEPLIEDIYKNVDIFTNQLILGDSLLEKVSEKINIENYLQNHLLNVCIISLTIGLKMNFNKSKLHVLGMASILHDIGMTGFKDITSKKGLLSQEELKKIKEHPFVGANIISGIRMPFDSVKEIIEQHHERTNGSGYSLGLKGNNVNE